MSDSQKACFDAVVEILFDDDVSILKSFDGRWIAVDNYGKVTLRGSDGETLKFDTPWCAYQAAVDAGMFTVKKTTSNG